MNSIKQYQAITFGGVERNPVLICEGTIIPVQTNWNSLASLPIVSLNLRARCVKSVAKLVNRLLFSIVWRKYCLLTDIYRAFTTPHVNYCSEPWHHCGKRGSGKPLKKINERALRFVTRDKSTMYQEALATTGCISLHTRRMELCSKLFTKIKAPESRLRHLVPPTRSQAHGRSLRNKDRPSLISCKTERFKRSFFPAMCLYAHGM